MKKWLRGQQALPWPTANLYIIGPDGRDILGRRLSDSAARRLEFFNRESMRRRRARRHSPSSIPPGRRRSPPPAQFPAAARARRRSSAPDGSTYTVLLVPRRPSIFGALSLPGISLMILCIALVVSAFASWWLARAPERAHPPHSGGRARARRARISMCAVSAGLEGRKDELAVLARDFDAMADQLRANRGAITQLLRDISHELRSPLAQNAPRVGPRAPADRRLRAPAGSPGARDRAARRADQPGTEARAAATARMRRSSASAFDVDEMIEEVVRDANFEGAAKGCKMRTRGAPRIAAVNGSRELLRSAIENVLRNAVRYSPQGAPVEVAVGAQRSGLDDRRFAITDPACRRRIWSASSSRSTEWPNRATATPAARASVSPSPLRS